MTPSQLPKLIQADCNHFIPEDSEPYGERYETLANRYVPVFLCQQCISQLRQQPKPEHKAVRK